MPSFLISDTRVFDGERVIHDHGYVLIEGDCITAISTVKPTLLPVDCVMVQGSGCTVLPGLIDAHVHAYNDLSFLEKAIQYGVTTVLDMHNEPDWFRNLKDIADKRNDISDIRSVCYAATIKNGWPSTIVQMSSPDPDVSSRVSPFLI
jgi:dihydroorotase-like cyclic amidohydrolase